MLLAPYTTVIAQEARNLLRSSIPEGDFRQLVEEGLGQPGRCFSAFNPVGGSVLCLLVCEAISGHCRQAGLAATALEFLQAAADTFDEVEDGDADAWWKGHGDAVAVNLAAALLMLSQKATARMVQAQGKRLASSELRAMNDFALRSLAGQHDDLTSEQRAKVSQRQCLDMISRKSASVAECCCYLGALLATGSKQFVAPYAAFGHNFGMAAQIRNDASSFRTPAEATGDIGRKKKTLPVIFALAQAKGTDRRFLREAYLTRGCLSKEVGEEVRHTVLQLGGVHYALAVSELYKKRASDALMHPAIVSHNKRKLIALLQ